MTLQPNEQLELMFDVTARLERLAIDYMVSGSMALVFFGRPRMTRDVDLVVNLNESRVDALCDALADFEHDREEIREAARHQRMFNIIHSQQVLKFDLVVRKNEPYRLEEFSRRRRRQLGAREVWVVSPEDLLLSKLVWGNPTGSEVQLRDAAELIASTAELDWAYVNRWAKELGVTAYLEKARERHA